MNTILASLLAAATPAFGELPKEISTLVTKTAKTLSGTLEASYPDDGKNFVSLATRLKAHGFGEPPLDPPPWYAPDEEASDEVRKNQEGELQVRMQNIGDSELTFFKSLDVNEDHLLTKEEISQALTVQLETTLKERLAVDANNDKLLSLKEYALIVPARGEIDPKDGVDWHQRGHFKSDDANKDGVIDATENLLHEAEGYWTAALRIDLVHHLALQDQDGNKILTKKEFPALWTDSVKLSELYPAIYWFPPEKLKSLR